MRPLEKQWLVEVTVSTTFSDRHRLRFMSPHKHTHTHPHTHKQQHNHPPTLHTHTHTHHPTHTHCTGACVQLVSVSCTQHPGLVNMCDERNEQGRLSRSP